MNDRDRIEKFNRDLERIIREALPTEQPGESQADREDLEIARRLMEANFSSDSRQQAQLEGRLVEQISLSGRKAKWQAVGNSLHRLTGTLAWAALIVALVAGLSWAMRAFQPLPASEPTTIANLEATATQPAPTPQSTPVATQPPAWSNATTPTQTIPKVATQTVVNGKPAQTRQPSPTAVQPPVTVFATEVAPLTRYSTSDEVRQRLADSWRLWKTLWVDAQVTTTQRGRSTVEREQVWYQQPSQGVWMAGPINGNPDVFRVRAGGKTVETDLETVLPRDLGNIRLVPSMLDKALFPNWSFAIRAGTFRVTGDGILAGRSVVIVEFYNVEDVKSDRFWIDKTTGIILRWVHLPARSAGASERDQLLEIDITNIATDVEFPAGIFEPTAPLPGQFSPGYWLLGEQK